MTKSKMILLISLATMYMIISFYSSRNKNTYVGEQGKRLGFRLPKPAARNKTLRTINKIPNTGRPLEKSTPRMNINMSSSFASLVPDATSRNPMPSLKVDNLKANILEVSSQLESRTDPKYSYYSIVNGKRTYTLCDTIELLIQTRNPSNDNKTYGGDFIWVWIYNSALKASATADEMVDHNNGTYTVTFKTRWTGLLQIGVSLIHSSETVAMLRRMREKYPARYSYRGLFKSPQTGQVAITACHVTPELYIPVKERHERMQFCNFTDVKTGFPWFCVKPVNWTCGDYFQHSSGGSAIEFHQHIMTSNDTKLYVKAAALNPLEASHKEIEVFSNITDDNRTTSTCSQLPTCTVGIPPRQQETTPGFYYNDSWTSLVCNKSNFDAADISECLHNKSFHLIGDSTLRQWYKYLLLMYKTGNNTVIEHNGNHPKFGPFKAFDESHNTTLHFTFHGYPIALGGLTVSLIDYVPNQLDSLNGTEYDVICLSLWAHFTGTNLQFYIDRLRGVKAAIVRLQKKNPQIAIFIKSANTREYSYDFDRSNWYSWEVDKVMRHMMSEMPGVTIIDVWDMTIGHRSGYILHPVPAIISQEIDMLLSFICPATDR